MDRRINPTSTPELPLRMLYQPAGEGSFHRACEADSFRGLVAAILDGRMRLGTAHDYRNDLLDRLFVGLAVPTIITVMGTFIYAGRW